MEDKDLILIMKALQSTVYNKSTLCRELEERINEIKEQNKDEKKMTREDWEKLMETPYEKGKRAIKRLKGRNIG